jgi:hypothetical protein
VPLFGSQAKKRALGALPESLVLLAIPSLNSFAPSPGAASSTLHNLWSSTCTVPAAASASDPASSTPADNGYGRNQTREHREPCWETFRREQTTTRRGAPRDSTDVLNVASFGGACCVCISFSLSLSAASDATPGAVLAVMAASLVDGGSRSCRHVTMGGELSPGSGCRGLLEVGT